MQVRNPYFPAIANTWQQEQKLSGGAAIPGNAGSNPGMWFYSFAEGGFNPGINVGWYLTSDGIIFNVTPDSGLYAQNHGGALVGFSSNPTAISPTVASGTVYQNTTNSYQTLTLPFYASTAGTAGSVTINMGTSSTPGTWTTVYVSGSTTSTACTNYTLRVPPQWYYEVVVTGATIGTVNGVQE